ncbi:hypothetical protein GCM10011319_43020 [Mameliella alba]|nr:hypothetical protein GCM10011319_43020 [Mameliella alba]
MLEANRPSPDYVVRGKIIGARLANGAYSTQRRLASGALEVIEIADKILSVKSQRTLTRKIVKQMVDASVST